MLRRPSRFRGHDGVALGTTRPRSPAPSLLEALAGVAVRVTVAWGIETRQDIRLDTVRGGT